MSVLGPTTNLGEAVNAYLDEKMRGSEFEAAEKVEESKLEANDADLQAARNYKDHQAWISANVRRAGSAEQHDETKVDEKALEREMHDKYIAKGDAEETADSLKLETYTQQAAARHKYKKETAVVQAKAEAAASDAWRQVQSHGAKEAKEKAAVNTLPN